MDPRHRRRVDQECVYILTSYWKRVQLCWEEYLGAAGVKVGWEDEGRGREGKAPEQWGFWNL